MPADVSPLGSLLWTLTFTSLASVLLMALLWCAALSLRGLLLRCRRSRGVPPLRLGLLAFLLSFLLGCAAGSPVPAARPSMPPGPQPGICGRTPEVQVALLRALAVDGPRMSCGAVEPPELYRLRSLSVDVEYLAPGDFRHLHSLLELRLGVVAATPLPAGVFDGLASLRRLTLTAERRGAPDPRVLSPGVFVGLDSLEALELNGRRGSVAFRLDGPNLRGLEGLAELDVDSVAVVTPGAFLGMDGLRRLRLQARYVEPSRRDEESPVFPREALEALPGLERVTVRHFRK